MPIKVSRVGDRQLAKCTACMYQYFAHKDSKIVKCPKQECQEPREGRKAGKK